jgi:hypothetical protein
MSPKYMVIYNNSCVTIAKSKVKVTTQWLRVYTDQVKFILIGQLFASLYKKMKVIYKQNLFICFCFFSLFFYYIRPTTTDTNIK